MQSITTQDMRETGAPFLTYTYDLNLEHIRPILGSGPRPIYQAILYKVDPSIIHIDIKHSSSPNFGIDHQ